MNRFIVKRKDIVSNKIMNIDELFRLAIIDNKLIYDKYKNLKHRGIYIAKNKEAIDIAFLKKLKRYNQENFDKLQEELYEELDEGR